MEKRLPHIIFSKVDVLKYLIYIYRMYSLYVIFAKYLDICKQKAGNLANEQGNVPRPVGKICALTILQYINCKNKKPIGRIQYAMT